MGEIATEKKLTPAQRKAIEALLTTGNVKQAAQEAGVHRSSIYKWMADDVFRAALRDAEQAAVESLSRSLVALGEKAATALSDALESNNKISVRLRASEVVIGNLLRLRELTELERRLTALEKGSDNV